jgi:predicted ATP-grasp superfamily ATP-dependent carboligase
MIRGHHSTRILLSEGSSLSGRQAITALGIAGYRVDVCDPDPVCLGRFSRFVRRFHRCPPMSGDPLGYLKFVVDLVARESFAVLLPTHEQAYLFASARDRLPSTVGVALSSFESFERVQSKAEFSRVLIELALPQPRTQLVSSSMELLGLGLHPAYIKTTIGTASRGVRFVRDAIELTRAARQLESEGAFENPVLVQETVTGWLERAQTVFDRGRLVALHAYRQMLAGPGGGDIIKISVRRPVVRRHLAMLGEYLNWHGALSIDYILNEGNDSPSYIDCNPRLVEPVNATFSGVPLAETLVRLSLGESPSELRPGRAGVKTRMGILSLIENANRYCTRTELLRELWRLCSGSGHFAGTVEELTPVQIDWLSALPLVWVAVWMLATPRAAHNISGTYASSHQLSGKAIKIIRDRYYAIKAKFRD